MMVTIITSAWSSLLLRLLLAQKRHKIVASAAFLSLVVKVIANSILVDRWGIVGIAWATVIASGTATVFRYLLAIGGLGRRKEAAAK
jgi:Na+-driven multidrug efflux pump